MVLLTLSTLYAQEPPKGLDAAIERLSRSSPIVAPPVLPTLPNQQKPDSPSYDATYASVVQVDCDGVRHQILSRDFGAWADQMRASNIREVRVVMPYNPHGDEGVELWRLGKWPELETLNLRDFKGQNVVRTGPRSWTTRGAVYDYPSVRKLWLYYGMRPSFGRFPNLDEVHFAENDPGAAAEAKRLGPSVKTNTYGRIIPRPSEPRSYSDLRQIKDITLERQLTFKGPLSSSDLSELAQCSELRRLRIQNAESLVDLRSIANLKQLETLELVDCDKLKDLSGLSGLSYLTKLSIIESSATIRREDLEPLVNLEYLRLCWCEALVNLDALPNPVKLRHLDLSGTKVVDFSPLGEMENLQVLCLDHATNLDELKFLEPLTSVRRLIITNCPRISLPQIRKIQAALPACSVHFEFRP